MMLRQRDREISPTLPRTSSSRPPSPDIQQTHSEGDLRFAVQLWPRGSQLSSRSVQRCWRPRVSVDKALNMGSGAAARGLVASDVSPAGSVDGGQWRVHALVVATYSVVVVLHGDERTLKVGHNKVDSFDVLRFSLRRGHT